jgi:hypothetical protein
VVSKRAYLKLPTTTGREWSHYDHWDQDAHGSGKECLTETKRPGFISTVSPDLPQTTHHLEEEDTIGGTLFLRLKVSHLCPKYRVLNDYQYVLLSVVSTGLTVQRDPIP